MQVGTSKLPMTCDPVWPPIASLCAQVGISKLAMTNESVWLSFNFTEITKNFISSHFCLANWNSWQLNDLKVPTAHSNYVIHGRTTSTLIQNHGRTESNSTRTDQNAQQVANQWAERVVSKMMSGKSYSSANEQRGVRICGRKWQKNYKKLHRDILESRRRRQFIVFTYKEEGFPCSGYGNRLGAITSLLFLSILTERAFLIEWDVGVHVPLEVYLEPKAIAWNYSMENLNAFDTRTHFWGLRRSKFSSNRTDVLKVAGTKSDFIAWLQQTDFQTYFDRPVEKVVGMWYFANNLWENKFFKKQILGMEISSERPNSSLVGCAFDFLFQKSTKLQARLDAARTSLALTSQARKLGLHVRMGDISMGKKSLQYINIDFKHFFDCAQALSEALARKNRRAFRKEDIRWFLATDDTEVKEYALKNYPANAVTLMMAPQHIKKLEKQTQSASVEEGMYDIMVDHFLLAECDFLILSERSTFGRTAAGLMFHSDGAVTSGTTCGEMLRNSPTEFESP